MGEWRRRSTGGRRAAPRRVEGAPAESASPEWAANAPFPTTSIIGLDDADDRLCVLYADARGVHRIYELSLTDTVWRRWRAAPGFHQRFAGMLSGDGATITGRCEGSRDGESWALDFDVVYTRVA